MESISSLVTPAGRDSQAIIFFWQRIGYNNGKAAIFSGIDGHKILTRWRCRLTVTISPPSHDTAIAFEGKAVLLSGGDSDKIASHRRRRLTVVVVAPSFVNTSTFA